MKKRIYLVQVKGSDARLVRAGTPAQARGHVTKDIVKVRVANTEDMVDMRSTTVEEAGED